MSPRLSEVMYLTLESLIRTSCGMRCQFSDADGHTAPKRICNILITQVLGNATSNVQRDDLMHCYMRLSAEAGLSSGAWSPDLSTVPYTKCMASWGLTISRKSQMISLPRYISRSMQLRFASRVIFKPGGYMYQ